MSSIVSIQKALESIILDPRYADILAVAKAARNGAIYGAKVRFPHALVMISSSGLAPFWRNLLSFSKLLGRMRGTWQNTQ